jgi:hypothetical protein
MATHLDLIEKIIAQSPVAVSQIYNKYGIYAKPSVQTTLDAIDTFGDPFLMELFNLHYAEQSFLGIHLGKKKETAATVEGKAQQTQADQKEKSTLWDKFKGVFTKGTKAVSDANNVLNQVQTDANKVVTQVNQVKQIAGSIQSIAGPPQPAMPKDIKKQAPAKTILGIDATMFYILLAVLVMLVLGFLYMNSKK